MFYLMSKDLSRTDLMIKGECKEVTPELRMKAVHENAEWVCLDDAIRMYAGKLNKDGKRIHVGVDIAVKREDKMIRFKWDLWRNLMEYTNLNKRPSDAWVLKYLTPKLCHNVPLDPESIIKFHWVD